MIKLFRSVRKLLISEGNFSKYIKYAVGEIVLVVIGILLALQINTWNEQRKKGLLKDSYIQSLIDDLSMDTLMMGRMVKINREALSAVKRQQQRFLGPETPIDTLIQIARFEFDPEVNNRIQYNRNTLNTLIASGNIDLFNKEMNKLLMALISSQEIERENSNYYLEIYSSKVSRFSDIYPVTGHMGSSIVDAIWRDADRMGLASGFISLTDIKGFVHAAFIGEMEKLKNQTIEILDRLNDNK